MVIDVDEKQIFKPHWAELETKKDEIDFLPQWSQMKEKANYTLDFLPEWP